MKPDSMPGSGDATALGLAALLGFAGVAHFVNPDLLRRDRPARVARLPAELDLRERRGRAGVRGRGRPAVDAPGRRAGRRGRVRRRVPRQRADGGRLAVTSGRRTGGGVRAPAAPDPARAVGAAGAPERGAPNEREPLSAMPETWEKITVADVAARRSRAARPARVRRRAHRVAVPRSDRARVPDRGHAEPLARVPDGHHARDRGAPARLTRQPLPRAASNGTYISSGVRLPWPDSNVRSLGSAGSTNATASRAASTTLPMRPGIVPVAPAP